ncbi:hypothetical protein GF327_02660 [Candidatus Woesearchaeota archaeon]|nr:hypothetical protein [Candidatus Woesearchaeota archaeon]
MKLLESIFLFIFFGSAGVLIEVLWSGFNNFIKTKDSRIIGHISVWMFPIYGSTLFIILFVQTYAGGFFWLARGTLYAILITFLEFRSGWIIRKIFGKAPWSYASIDKENSI